MAIRYPRAQTVMIFIVCVFLIGLTMFYMRNQSNPSQVQNDQGFTVTPSTQPNQVQISTNTDWRKQFIEPSKSNTFKVSAKNASSSAQTEQLTATDKLARNFFTKYMDLRQAGLSTNQNAVNSAVNDLIDTSVANTELPKPFTKANIHTVSLSDNSTLTNYGQAISGIEWAYIPSKDNNEAVIAEKALEQNDMSLLKQIDPVIVNYQKALSIMSSMSVPEPLASYHIDLMNGINLELFNAKALRHIDTDPVSGVSAINLEVTALTNMNDAVTSMTQYFSNNGVSVSL